MVFNWFRRQFNRTEETPETPASAPEVVTPETESATEPAAEEVNPAADYLTWAKAAYQNIRKQQEEVEQVEQSASELDVTPETPVETETPVVETPVAETSVVETPVAETPVVETPVETETPVVETPVETETPVVETPVAETSVVETPVAETSVVETPVEAETPVVETPVEAETSVVETPVEAETSVVETPAVAAETTETATGAPLSFLERAGAERQARIEELKERAIAEPEPEIQPVPVAATTTAETFTEIPDLAFDEGFLWSAEVLRASGRRADQISLEEITWLKRLRQGLDKTRRNLVNQLKAIVGQGPLNQDAVMEIESLLLQADVGVEATDRVIEKLQAQLRKEVLPPEQAIAYLKQILRDMLDNPGGEPCNPTFAPDKDTLNIWLMTGVNGAGKTTTIGKIAHIARKSGYRTLIGAADTFRAAAVEQVKIWGQRSGVETIANPGKNTDPAAVVYDAIAAAKARNTELLLIDTAGRLQNKKNLMEELSKIRRIIDKNAPNTRVESLLVLDATLGQNGLRQAKVFCEVAKLSGVVLTKLDGTAKGGVALAVVEELGLPIRFIGAGEGIEDLRPFSSYEFVEALISG